MRASKQARTGPAAGAPAASTSSVDRPSRGRSKPSASPCPKATAKRTPVNAPGPIPTAIRSSAERFKPASASKLSIHGSTSSACRRGAISCRAIRLCPLNSATEQTSVEVSMANKCIRDAPTSRVNLSVANDVTRINSRQRSAPPHRHPASAEMTAGCAGSCAHSCVVADEDHTKPASRDPFRRESDARRPLQRDDCGGIANPQTVDALGADGGQARFQHRVIRCGKWQLVDHHHAERSASDIHAFPETGCPQQEAVARLTEGLQKSMGRLPARTAGSRRLRPARGFTQRAMRGEQQERATA